MAEKSALEKKLEKQVKDLIAANTVLTDKNADLETQLQALTDTNQNLGTQAEEAGAKIEELEKANQDLAALSAKDIDKIKELTEKNSALQEGADQLEQENADLKAGEVKPSSKEKRGEEVPDFMKPGYTGSLTIDQAEKRRKAGVKPEAAKKK